MTVLWLANRLRGELKENTRLRSGRLGKQEKKPGREDRASRNGPDPVLQVEDGGKTCPFNNSIDVFLYALHKDAVDGQPMTLQHGMWL